MEPTLLLLLHHGPAHGYTLLGALNDYGLEGTDPSAVYRALRDMEGQGWVASTWEGEQTLGPPRRISRLTARGDETLGLWTRDLQETRAMIDRLLAAYDRHMQEDKGEHH